MSPKAAAVAPVTTSKNVCEGRWELKDGSAFSISSPSNISYLESSFSSNRLADGVNNLLAKTAAYLAGHNDRHVVITGYYRDSENNSSILPNLGLARANSVKKMLVDKGVPSSQVEIAGKMSEDRCWSTRMVDGNERSTLHRAIDMNFGTLAKGEDRLSAIKSRLQGKPIILHFATNADKVNLTSQQRTDFADLIYYLDRVDAAKLDIDGHTDNEGERAYNLNLSKERADFAKNYIMRNGGISLAKMDVSGYGPDKPIATNSTAAGKAQNRRVEVTLK